MSSWVPGTRNDTRRCRPGCQAPRTTRARTQAIARRGLDGSGAGRRRFGRARQRKAEAARLRLAALRRVGLGRRRGGGRREDALLRLAVEQPQELVAVDGLDLEQDLRQPVQRLDVVAEHLAGGVVRLLDDPADLVVDLARDLLRVVGLVAELAPEERLVVAAAERARAELVAHAPA